MEQENTREYDEQVARGLDPVAIDDSSMVVVRFSSFARNNPMAFKKKQRLKFQKEAHVGSTSIEAWREIQSQLDSFMKELLRQSAVVRREQFGRTFIQYEDVRSAVYRIIERKH